MSLAAFPSKEMSEMSAVLRREQYTVKTCVKHEQHERNVCVTSTAISVVSPSPKWPSIKHSIYCKGTCLHRPRITLPMRRLVANHLDGQAAWNLWWKKW